MGNLLDVRDFESPEEINAALHIVPALLRTAMGRQRLRDLAMNSQMSGGPELNFRRAVIDAVGRTDPKLARELQAMLDAQLRAYPGPRAESATSVRDRVAEATGYPMVFAATALSTLIVVLVILWRVIPTPELVRALGLYLVIPLVVGAMALSSPRVVVSLVRALRARLQQHLFATTPPMPAPLPKNAERAPRRRPRERVVRQRQPRARAGAGGDGPFESRRR